MSKESVLKQLNETFKDQVQVIDKIIAAGNKKYTGSGWSPHKIAQHIVIAQDSSIKVLRRKKGKAEYLEVPFSHKLNYWLLKTFFFLNLKTKAPTLLSDPEGDTPLENLKIIMQQQCQEIENIIQDLEPQQWSKAMFRHPLTGLMSAKMMVNFLQLHWQHHKKQIEKRM